MRARLAINVASVLCTGLLLATLAMGAPMPMIVLDGLLALGIGWTRAKALDMVASRRNGGIRRFPVLSPRCLRALAKRDEDLHIADITSEELRPHLLRLQASIRAKDHLMVLMAQELQACRETLNLLAQILRCPLTLMGFHEPCVASDGHAYEKEELERALAEHGFQSPITREMLKFTRTVKSFALRDATEALTLHHRRFPIQDYEPAEAAE